MIHVSSVVDGEGAGGISRIDVNSSANETRPADFFLGVMLGMEAADDDAGVVGSTDEVFEEFLEDTL